MELFNGATAVRLRSHHNKYLVAKSDAEHVSQDPSATAVGTVWTVEYVGEPHDPLIRLKSCYTRYLLATNELLPLSLTGRKVLQTVLDEDNPRPVGTSIDWQAIRDGTKVRLRTPYGNFLCANGGIRPFNSVTSDIAEYIPAFCQKWVDWAVEVVPHNFPLSRPMSSSHLMGNSFKGARLVRLRSHHNLYLAAEEDKVHVSQFQRSDRLGSLWTVELPSDASFIRLKSCYDSYLTALDDPFLLGMTGFKVIQTIPARLDSSVEWEPIVEGEQVKLKHRNGRFLRANGRVRPWRDSVTNDIPLCNPMKKWLVWDVQIVDHYLSVRTVRPSTPGSSTPTSPAKGKPSSSILCMSPRLSTGESSPSLSTCLPITRSRTIKNSVADEELEETQHGGINCVLPESSERKTPSSSPRSASPRRVVKSSKMPENPL